MSVWLIIPVVYVVGLFLASIAVSVMTHAGQIDWNDDVDQVVYGLGLACWPISIVMLGVVLVGMGIWWMIHNFGRLIYQYIPYHKTKSDKSYLQK